MTTLHWSSRRKSSQARVQVHVTVLCEEVSQRDAVVVGPHKDEYVPDCVSEGQVTVQLEEDYPTEEEDPS